jgi:dephospho-CoA kinase
VKRLVVGLAGGVGSGKSTVARILRRLRRARVIDADAVGHRVLARPAVRRRLAARFGREILGREGAIDRRELARRAFRSRKDLEALNRETHPAILREIRKELDAARGWVVLDASLLFESGADALCDRVIFVDAPRRVREARVAARGWAPGERARREALQWPAARKRKRSDVVIDNGGPESRTARELEAWLAGLDRPAQD